MDIDQLRRAANKLRTHANRAPEGPWVSLDDGDRLVALRENRELFPNGFRYLVDEPIDDTSTAEYFALMHPPVALALADWLDVQAQAEEGRVEQEQRMLCKPGALITHRDEQAYAVARAILRESLDGAA